MGFRIPTLLSFAALMLLGMAVRASADEQQFATASDDAGAILMATDNASPAAMNGASKPAQQNLPTESSRPRRVIRSTGGESLAVADDHHSKAVATAAAAEPPRQFVPITDADELPSVLKQTPTLAPPQPRADTYTNEPAISTPQIPESEFTDARLTDEEVALIRRWARGVAQHEDRNIKDAGYARQDPFADDPDQPGDPPPMPPLGETPPADGDVAASTDAKPNSPAAAGFDPAVIAAGSSAFQSSCTGCHDAERSTNARKSFGGWMATVRRMAGKDGADIAPSDVQPIATYLASLNPAATTAASAGVDAAAATESSWSLFSTVSLIHRSGDRETIENDGFFLEVWLGAEWHPAGPLSGRVNACVSCHTENASVSNRIELAEGFFRLDMMELLGCSDPECQPFQFHVDAGRFVVPFGAFAAQSHPGAFRTATRPLMYNMGQNVYREELPPPLLPMPYSDEGVLASATLPLFAEVNATFDFYAINGLQGSTDLELGSWYQSRDYVDNNSEPAVGGRATIGNKYLRAGASLMSGRYNESSLQQAVPELLDYKIYGADVVARYEDWVRIQVEWARRDNDAFDFIGGAVEREAIKGTVVEGEFKLWTKPKISAIVRYDDQRRTDGPARFGTPVTSPDVAVQRFTYGLNFALGSSTLMINHEHWKVPAPLDNQDVLAIRWVAAF